MTKSKRNPLTLFSIYAEDRWKPKFFTHILFDNNNQHVDGILKTYQYGILIFIKMYSCKICQWGILMKTHDSVFPLQKDNLLKGKMLSF